jgi:hypothetical protein
MVELLANFADDSALPPEFRLACAKDVLDRAGGRVQRKLAFQNLDPDAPIDDDAGRTVEMYIAEATAEASKITEAQRYVGKVPVEEWPQWVIERFIPAE